MKELYLFIDENLLDIKKLKELDKLAEKVHYVYIKIDPISIRNKDKTVFIANNIETNKKQYTYYISHKYLKNLKDIEDSELFQCRFHIIERIEKNTLYEENFRDNQNLHHNWDFPIRISHNVDLVNRYNSIVDKLKEIYQYWPNHQKDMYLIAHFLLCDNNYQFIKTLDVGNMYKYYFDDRKPKLVNPNSYKYLISYDQKRFFNKQVVKSIEQTFSNIKIFTYNDLLTNFLVFTE